MTADDANRDVLERHLRDLFATGDITLQEEPTELTGWSFFRAREAGDRQDPTNWAVHAGHVIIDSAAGLDHLGDDLGRAENRPSADDVAVAVVSITRDTGRVLTTARLADESFWRRWRRKPRLTARDGQLVVRCLVTHTGRGSADEEVTETLTLGASTERPE